MTRPQIGDTRQLFETLRGLEVFHGVQAELQKAWDLAEYLPTFAQHHSDPALIDADHLALGTVYYHLGAFAQAHTHLEQGVVIYDSQLEPSPAFLYARGPKVVCASWSALTLSRPLSAGLWAYGVGRGRTDSTHRSIETGGKNQRTCV